MINDTRRDAIFDEMNGYILSLDPSATGPRYFIDKIAICRNYLNNVSLVLSELQRDKLVTSSELNKLQAVIELEGASILATDVHVQRLANIKDRESMVAHMLRDKRARIDFLKDQIHSIDGIMKHVSLRNRELHATMDAIKNQRRFMQIEVSTGSFYGDERLPDHERTVGMGFGGTTGDFGEGEIRALIEQSSADPSPDIAAALEEAAAQMGIVEPKLLPAAPPPAAAPEPVSGAPMIQEPQTPEDAEALRQFLGDDVATDEPSRGGPQGELEDYSSLLDSV